MPKKKPKKKISRQARWQKEKDKAKLCRQCGWAEQVLGSKYCLSCLRKNRKRMRARSNSKKWQPGHRGRPPLQV